MRTWHLWREYQQAPYQRWACDVVEDLATADGWRVVALDHQVATSVWLTQLHEYLSRALRTRAGTVEDDGTIVDGVVVLHPGEPGHLAAALTGGMPFATVRDTGRS